MADSLSRVLLWLLVIVLVLQLSKGGWAQMKAWLSAKFFGVNPTTAPAA